MTTKIKTTTEKEILANPRMRSDGKIISMIEDLTSYYYSVISPKYTKLHRATLGKQTEDLILRINRLAIKIASYRCRFEREKLLGALDEELKVLQVFIRVSYKNNSSISEKNRDAWIRKVAEIDNFVVGWEMKLQKK